MSHTEKAHMVVLSNHVAPLLLVLQILDLPPAMRQLPFQVPLYVRRHVVGFCEPPLNVSSALLDFVQGLARRSAAAAIIARSCSVVFELLPLLESSVARGWCWWLDVRVCSFRTHVVNFWRSLRCRRGVGSINRRWC